MADKIRAVIIGDHPLFRHGVAQALGGAPGIEALAQGSTQVAVTLTEFAISTAITGVPAGVPITFAVTCC